jgi:hypothetical protein
MHWQFEDMPEKAIAEIWENNAVIWENNAEILGKRRRSGNFKRYGN